MFPGVQIEEFLYFEIYSYTLIGLLTEMYFEMFASHLLELDNYSQLSDA
jgi:hypothetical protein